MSLRHLKYPIMVREGPIEVLIDGRMHPGTIRVGPGLGETQLFIWANVDDDLPPETHRFFVYGTGHEVPPIQSLRFIDTVQCKYFVWHVYIEVRA